MPLLYASAHCVLAQYLGKMSARRFRKTKLHTTKPYAPLTCLQEHARREPHILQNKGANINSFLQAAQTPHSKHGAAAPTQLSNPALLGKTGRWGIFAKAPAIETCAKQFIFRIQHCSSLTDISSLQVCTWGQDTLPSLLTSARGACHRERARDIYAGSAA